MIAAAATLATAFVIFALSRRWRRRRSRGRLGLLDRRRWRGGRRRIVIAASATATTALAVATLLRLLGWWARRCRLRSGSVAVAIAPATPFAFLWLSLGSRCWRGLLRLRRGRRRLLGRGRGGFTGRWSTGVGRLRNLQGQLSDFTSYRPWRGGTKYGEANSGGNWTSAHWMAWLLVVIVSDRGNVVEVVAPRPCLEKRVAFPPY
jgi:hypothetical protein